ncbi:transmembrane protein 164 [Belonocnema kinseyi]|uniref:transmembrane protein 164 n=1 Tax=Belonocnema kinseyi TaxID=2817044 RepID=UPI00143CD641|nr:transmembrane protein 164 [Belonocnema kinseyi]XP_033228205.1 transmembrane protein 164 [Belonocnema kinseyi]XP_033228206.1 transmembrane protein 164 [Belonocnema kinseyi]XP_033228207.1 transmembrane protein 164 [Belonocnema kinseyi]
MLEWAYDGVNSSIPRNSGPECANYMSPRRRLIETFCVSIFIIFCLSWGYKRIKLPKPMPYVNQDRVGKRVLLIVMSLVLGMEIGFKLTSRTFIYFMNPCHVHTIAQLYLLAADPSPMATAVFRVQMNYLNGPLLAYVFPETESRNIFADKACYYVQHGLMVVIPYYLLRLGGAYNVEPFMDLSWPVFSYGLNLAYHFWILQAAALPVQVNLNHMLCPALLDPFEGQYYRLWATAHQSLLCPLLGKVFCLAANFFLTKFPVTKIKPTLDHPISRQGAIPDKIGTQSISDGCINGHTHVD